MRNASRHPAVSTIKPPIAGREDGQCGSGGRPHTECTATRDVIEGMGDERDRTGDEQCAGGSLGEPEDDQPFERWRKTAEGRGRREPGEPDRVDAPPAVVVGQGSGQDQERCECREVPADDIRLALEDADDGRRQLLSDLLERDVDDRAVEEDGTRPDDRRDEGPALAGGHRSKSRRCARRASRVRRRRWIDSRAMPGPVALVGAGEFLPAMSDFDAVLLGLDRAREASRRDPSDRFVSRRRGCLHPLGDVGPQPISATSAPRSSRSSSAIEPALTIPRPPRRSARRTSSICRAASRATCSVCSSGSAVGPRLWPPTIAARSSPDVQRERWSSPATHSISGLGSRPGRCGGGKALGFVPQVPSCPTTTLGRSRCRPSSRFRHPAAHRCSASTRRRPRRPGWFVAGPWPFARHGVARTSPRAVSSRREPPALTSRRRRRGALFRATKSRPLAVAEPARAADADPSTGVNKRGVERADTPRTRGPGSVVSQSTARAGRECRGPRAGTSGRCYAESGLTVRKQSEQ